MADPPPSPRTTQPRRSLRLRVKQIVDTWGIQLTLYALMWVMLFLGIALSALVVGPGACAAPQPVVDERFERRL
jgi:hypothetical protein